MSKLFQAVTEGSIQSANNQKEVYLIEESSLRNRFGSNWNKLMEESQSSLISARVIFKLLDQIPQETALDYSGPCISATSALERELKRIFQDNYSGFSGKYDFTLGDFPTILECYKNQAGKWTPEDQISSVLRDYLCSIIKKRYIANKSDPRTCFLSKKLPDGSVLDFSFIDTIDFVRRRYRNPAAHTDRLSKKTAEQCFTRIMGALDAETRLTMTESALWFLMEVIN